MKKILISLLVITNIYGQHITVNPVHPVNQPVAQLVNNILLDNVVATNVIQFNYESPYISLGSFTNTNPNFPLTEGIILSTGPLAECPGPRSASVATYQGTGWDGDDDVLSFIDATYISTNPEINFITYEATAIRFNFNSSEFDRLSLEFVFASDEYGKFQCGYADTFIFLLKDLTTGESSNIAVTPSEDIISVTTIRNQEFNPANAPASCISVNPDLFSTYYPDGNQLAPINFRGHTVLLNSTAELVPNRNYQIKIAIADFSDWNYNSAIFLKAHSFRLHHDEPEQPPCYNCTSFDLLKDEKYLVSAWVKEEYENDPHRQFKNYENSAVSIGFTGVDGNFLTSPVQFFPSGEIIDGWQRIVGEFIVPTDVDDIHIELLNLNQDGKVTYFDDVRVLPSKGNMKSFVYDQKTQRLMAELDENNYSTFYEYDLEGGLIRVKKETERGVFTIQETRSGNTKK